MLIDITAEDIARIFPLAPKANVLSYWKDLKKAFVAANFSRLETIVALCTIAAECAPFEPLVEGISKYNTAPGGPPYGLYDGRVDLGNKLPGDGARFCGRGWVQLTGRANYQKIGPLVGVDLVATPEAAMYSLIGAQILVAFLTSGNKRARFVHFATDGDLASLRKTVNGGINGLDHFKAAWKLAFATLPVW